MTLRSCAVAACVIGLTLSGHSQSITGSTTASIDPNTGIVTATCETDLDTDAQPYYGAQVVCILTDGNGNQVDSGQSDDDDGSQGYAQVVLTYQGTPGNIYFATGQHLAFLIYSDIDEGLRQGYEEDYYNMEAASEQFAEGYDYVPLTYTYFAQGPETPTRKDTIKVANTNDSVADPLAHATVAVNFSGPIDPDDADGPNYATFTGFPTLTAIIGNLPNNGGPACLLGNEEVGTIVSGSQLGPYTVKRFLTAQTCFFGAAGNTPPTTCGNIPSFPYDDTGPTGFHTTTPSNSKVFNLDAPGVGPGIPQDSSIQRVRLQFEIHVIDQNGTMVSPKLMYYVRVSCTYKPGQAAPALSTDVGGDNTSATGITPMTWNLK